MHGAGVVRDDGGAGVAGGDDLGEGEGADGVEEVAGGGALEFSGSEMPGSFPFGKLRVRMTGGFGRKSEAGEVGADPGIVGTAEEEDFEVAGEEVLGDGGVVFGGPAAEGLLAKHVAGSAGDEGDAGAGGALGGGGPAGEGCGGEAFGGEGREGGVAAGVGPAEEDAGELVGVVAVGDELEAAVGAGKLEAAAGADGEGEEAVAGVVVEGGDEVEAMGEEVAPEFGEGSGAGGKGCAEEGAVVGDVEVDPGVEVEEGGDGGAAEPMDFGPCLVEEVGSGEKHERVADGAEFDEEDFAGGRGGGIGGGRHGARLGSPFLRSGYGAAG